MGAGLRERLSPRNAPADPTPSASAAGTGMTPAELAAFAESFAYELPEGWQKLPASGMRLIDLRLESDPTFEVSLVILGGSGGGTLANVNRWRRQVGQAAAVDLSELDLQTKKVMRQDAVYVELTGPYQGMSGPRIEDGALFGAMITNNVGTAYIKMTGPRSTLEAERENFLTFMESLDFQVGAMPGGQPGGQPGAGAGGAPTTGRPPSPVTWTSPAGWSEIPSTSQFREVTFRRGSVEMYVSLSVGDALGCVNRWAGQISAPDLDTTDLEALPKLPSMGREAYVYEAVGPFRGMRDPAPLPDQRMVAALVSHMGQNVTLKMIGPNADVAAARADFDSLLSSLAAR